ncbi:MAG: Uncharacterised protein [Halieaceae bacterium]|nr:MAG: Uncharacterised protein [Halieaceae bacterium]
MYFLGDSTRAFDFEAISPVFSMGPDAAALGYARIRGRVEPLAG